MSGALLFGVVNHFVTAGPDNVLHMPATGWARTFQASAVGLALTEAAGVAIGLRGWATADKSVSRG